MKNKIETGVQNLFGSMMFPAFLGMIVFVFFLLPVKYRPVVLLFSSYLACAFISLSALAVLIAVSVWVWAEGIWIENLQNKKSGSRGKIAAVSAVCACILLLAVLKYGRTKLMVPVGLSFYIFQAIGYLADVASGKCSAERNFSFLGCYFAFFPKFVSGPIEREYNFLSQIKRLEKVRFWDRGRLSTAFTYILWGYFMKMVVADRLSMQVSILFDKPQEFDSFWLMLGVIFYTIQIYCDFAGYSYIAIGCAQIFGIELAQNFKAPYQAKNISEFWRRWHVSLSSWLRDYIYIPLGGSRKGFGRKCINTMIVFIICGIWHGAGFQFILWGFLHGIYSVIDSLFQRNKRKVPAGRLLTFAEVAFAWIFFRAENLGQAWFYISRMMTTGIHVEQIQSGREILGLGGVEIFVISVGIFLVWVVDELCSRKQTHLPILIQQRKNSVRYLIFYFLLIGILIFGIYGPGYHTEQFIYMQF